MNFIAERPDDHWINEPRFAEFREAYVDARHHYSLAAESYAKVDVVDAYWIWKTIQNGMEKQARAVGPGPGS